MKPRKKKSPAQLDREIAQALTKPYFAIGDIVLMGKYKNKRGAIIGFGEDKWGIPRWRSSPSRRVESRTRRSASSRFGAQT